MPNGKLLPDTERKAVLDGLEAQLDAVRTAPPLEAETVISAVDALGKRLEDGEFAPAAVPVPARRDGDWTSCSPCCAGRAWRAS